MINIKLKWLFLACCATLLVAASGYFALVRYGSDRTWFYVWRYFSAQVKARDYTTVNGIRLYYEIFGQGQPVLILHGGLGGIEDMHYQIRALATTRLVIAPDLRGHGRSDDSEAPLTYSLMADDVLGLLDHLHVAQADVIGWSDGGIVGLDLAMRYPERVHRLVAISANFNVAGLANPPPLDPPVPSVPLYYWRNAPDYHHWPMFYRKLMTMWRTQPQYSVADLRRISVPTLIMAGSRDVILRKHTDQLAQAIPFAKEVILEGGTHFAITEQAARVNQEIMRFLASP